MTEAKVDVHWRIFLAAPREEVFALLATDEGRVSFWAEASEQVGGWIRLRFPDGETLRCRVLRSDPPHSLSMSYFGGSVVTFELRQAEAGTDLLLSESGVPPGEVAENRAGWVSVLLALKARADHGIDLRNHDPARTWRQHYCDN